MEGSSHPGVFPLCFQRSEKISKRLAGLARELFQGRVPGAGLLPGGFWAAPRDHARASLQGAITGHVHSHPATTILQRCQAEFAELLGDNNLKKYYFFFLKKRGLCKHMPWVGDSRCCFFLWKFIAYQPTSSKFDGSAGNLKRIVLLQTG